MHLYMHRNDNNLYTIVVVNVPKIFISFNWSLVLEHLDAENPNETLLKNFPHRYILFTQARTHMCLKRIKNIQIIFF